MYITIYKQTTFWQLLNYDFNLTHTGVQGRSSKPDLHKEHWTPAQLLRVCGLLGELGSKRYHKSRKRPYPEPGPVLQLDRFLTMVHPHGRTDHSGYHQWELYSERGFGYGKQTCNLHTIFISCRSRKFHWWIVDSNLVEVWMCIWLCTYITIGNIYLIFHALSFPCATM